MTLKNTSTLNWCSANLEPPPSRPTIPMTAPLTCFLEPVLLKVVCTLCTPLNDWPWRSTLRTPWLLVLSAPPLLRLGQVSLLLIKTMVLYGLVLTTIVLITLLSRTSTHFLLCLDLFELLQGAVVFSKVDLRNAYHLVHKQGDECKMAFNTPTCPYEYLVMLFG